jgi:16S rRNA (adenine1518-N6/adenine1519-N6)-dimethyltransferase
MIPHTPRKRFGQNFLADRSTIARIVALIAPAHDDRVVEIGPGLAALTTPLLERVGHMDVVEIDRDLAARLVETYPADRLTVHVGDALDFDFTALGRDLRIVGNLPYNISSPLLFRLAAVASSLRDVHVMLQREVVDRMVASPGTAEYGRLSVSLGYHFRIERMLRVPAGAFRPVPKVESAFVRLMPHAELPSPARDEAMFARVVMAAFGKRRKTLRNALAGIAEPEQLRAAGVDPAVRGETLGIAQFAAIANRIADDRDERRDHAAR